jgi:HD-like signal output (HDOD) protein/CheY-like chemotaxis protein
MAQTPAKTILFVDDEPHILSALRRLLRREGWQILTAASGLEGLEVLQEQEIDLVVSDMVMSEMDGAIFLHHVKARWPTIPRIILTGYPKSEAVIRAYTEADIHQIIAKPWDEKELKEIIRNALPESDTLEEESQGLRQIINEMDALPPLPHVYTELRRVIGDAETSSAEAVAEVIMQDPVIAAKILQVANSSFFGQSRKVETINRAIVLLGLEMVGNLVLSASVFQTFATEEIEGFGHDDFWRHSIGCSLGARVVLSRSNPNRERLEKISLASILHDLGKFVFAQAMRDRYTEVVKKTRETGFLIAEIEREMLGTDHAAVGGYLADWWNLPTLVVDAIRWHHEPDGGRDDPQFISAIHLADVLAHRLQIGASGNGRIPEIHPFASEALGIAPDELDAIEAQIKDEMDGEEFLA